MKKFIFILCISIWAILLSTTGCKKDQQGDYNPAGTIIIDSFTPSRGSGRTEMLISGQNFTSDTSMLEVSVNGTILKVIAASTKQIMVVVPKKCGSGPVSVRIGKDSAKSEGIFQYLFTRTVSTLAGNGQSGFSNGSGLSAQFHFTDPVNNWYRSMGIVVDDDLNVYVADPGNHCIRKIDTAGNVTTLAGNPFVSGNADGKGNQATFSLPYDLYIDKSGNLYVADPGNWNIRKVTPEGEVTTLFYTSVDPWTLTMDEKDQTIYYSSCRIPGPVYQVKAPYTTAEVIIDGLNYPSCIRLDSKGNLIAAINGGNVITRFDATTWNATDIAGLAGTAGYVNGKGADARFCLPWGMAIDKNDNLYVAGNGTWNGGTDNLDQSVRYIENGSWEVSTFAGSGTAGYLEGVGSAASFSAPGGVAVDKNGTVYVIDKNNNVVRKIISE